MQGKRMARRKDGLLDEIASLPWPVGVVLGIIAFVFVRNIGGAFAPLAWVFLFGLWAAAGVSFLKGRQRSALLETQSGIESLKNISWREFEMLVGEAFRRRGYFIEETGLGGKDGGIDLVISKKGRTELVQCKQWRTRQVKASTVREMWGLVDHHRADGVKIVCVGEFTRDAAQFAENKSIELINGKRLLDLIEEVQSKPMRGRAELSAPKGLPATEEVPQCSRCGSSMARRNNRQTQQPFWGCSQFPRCQGTQPI